MWFCLQPSCSLMYQQSDLISISCFSKPVYDCIVLLVYLLSCISFKVSLILLSSYCYRALWKPRKMEAKFFRFLKIVGVGFKARAESEGRLLYLKLGYSHEVELTVPPAVRVFCFKPNIVCCSGIDKQRVHQFAAAVRSCKPPEVYKGKGIMYIDEVIKKKQGKKSHWSIDDCSGKSNQWSASVFLFIFGGAVFLIGIQWIRNHDMSQNFRAFDDVVVRQCVEPSSEVACFELRCSFSFFWFRLQDFRNE